MTGDLHLICGMAGAGKTTLAKKLEQSLPAIRLCPDEWIEPLLQKDNDRPEMDRLRPMIETLLWETAQKILQKGASVILENGFWHKAERTQYREQAVEISVRVMLHYIPVSKAELVQRIERRNADLPRGSFLIDPKELDLWLDDWFEAPTEAELNAYHQHYVY